MSRATGSVSCDWTPRDGRICTGGRLPVTGSVAAVDRAGALTRRRSTA